MRQKNCISKLRKEKGLSQAKLASIIGVSQSVILGWEKERSNISPRYYEKLEELFGVPIDQVIWEEEKDFSNIDLIELPKSQYVRECGECNNLELFEDDQPFGYCKHVEDVRRCTDRQLGCNHFSFKNPRILGEKRFYRSQVMVYCGNCIYWKIRNNEYKCTNIESPILLLSTPQKMFCYHWVGMNYKPLPKCLIHKQLKPGIVKQRIKQARKIIGKPLTVIAKELDVDVKTIKECEEGIGAIPLPVLIRFSAHYNISFKWLVGLTDEYSSYNDEDI